MITRNKALIIIAIGILLFFSSVYGLVFGYIDLLPVLGIILIVFGAALLLLASKPIRFCIPHISVMAISVVGIGLQVYVWGFKSHVRPPIGILLWAMMPYALCILLSVFSSIRKPVIAGTAAALFFDLWVYYQIFIDPQSSTAVLLLAYIPLWNTLILIPFITFLAWLIAKSKCPKMASP